MSEYQLSKHTTTEFVISLCDGGACEMECRCPNEKTAKKILGLLKPPVCSECGGAEKIEKEFSMSDGFCSTPYTKLVPCPKCQPQETEPAKAEQSKTRQFVITAKSAEATIEKLLGESRLKDKVIGRLEEQLAAKDKEIERLKGQSNE